MRQVRCKNCGQPLTVTVTLDFHNIPLDFDEEADEFCYNTVDAECSDEPTGPFVNA